MIELHDRAVIGLQERPSHMIMVEQFRKNWLGAALSNKIAVQKIAAVELHPAVDKCRNPLEDQIATVLIFVEDRPGKLQCLGGFERCRGGRWIACALDRPD